MQNSAAQMYNYKVVRQFTIMTVVWGVIGMSVGLLVASQLVWPALNMDLPWTSFGRLRPLHTNAVIFAFGGNALFATSYYVVQRTCRARLWGDRAASFTFWGYQAFIVMAALGYVLRFLAGAANAHVLFTAAQFDLRQGGAVLAHGLDGAIEPRVSSVAHAEAVDASPLWRLA